MMTVDRPCPELGIALLVGISLWELIHCPHWVGRSVGNWIKSVIFKS